MSNRSIRLLLESAILGHGRMLDPEAVREIANTLAGLMLYYNQTKERYGHIEDGETVEQQAEGDGLEPSTEGTQDTVETENELGGSGAESSDREVRYVC